MSYPSYNGYIPQAGYPPPFQQQYVVEQTYYAPPQFTVYITEEMVLPSTTLIEVDAPRRKKRKTCTIL